MKIFDPKIKENRTMSIEDTNRTYEAIPELLKVLTAAREVNGYISAMFDHGELDIEGDLSRTQINISDEMCRKIIDVCADSLVESAKEIANLMKIEVIETTAKKIQIIEPPENVSEGNQNG